MTGSNSDWNAARRAARLEDLTWMAETGESASGAAHRLGLNRDALEKWCANNATDLWRQLMANEPRDHNAYAGRDTHGLTAYTSSGRTQAARKARYRAKKKETAA